MTLFNEKDLENARKTKEELEAEIGETGASIVLRFKELVNERRYKEAREYWEKEVEGKPQVGADLRKYAWMDIKCLAASSA